MAIMVALDRLRVRRVSGAVFYLRCLLAAFWIQMAAEQKIVEKLLFYGMLWYGEALKKRLYQELEGRFLSSSSK